MELLEIDQNGYRGFVTRATEDICGIIAKGDIEVPIMIFGYQRAMKTMEGSTSLDIVNTVVAIIADKIETPDALDRAIRFRDLYHSNGGKITGMTGYESYCSFSAANCVAEALIARQQ
jgi:hypothetical protein